MRTKHLVLSSLITACCMGMTYAQDYNQLEVLQMASSFLGNNSEAVSVNGVSEAQELALTIDSLYLGEKPKMFLCQDGTNWVVFANEQSVTPVVCHGEGHIVLEELYESPLWFLLTESMIGLDSIRILGKDANPEGFAKDNDGTMSITASTSLMTPLLEKNGIVNNWNQEQNNDNTSDINKSYNKYCPNFYNVSNGRTIVGCTAVAMGQILWYWKSPASAQIPTSINKAGITSNTTETHYYNWSNMPGSIYNSTPISQINNVAGLLRDCGYAGNMIYASSGSSMTLTNAIYALRNDFQYSAHMKQYSSGAKVFNNIIKSEIAAGRPVMIQATHTSNATAHTFVIDGYDSNTEQYHLNLGWGGNHNNWYSVSGSNSYYNYRIARRMLYSIIPNSTQQASEYVDEDQNVTKNMVSITNNQITINDNNALRWAIYDIYGNLIQGGDEQLFSIDNLSKGLYIIRLQSTDNIESTIFIKQ